MRESSTALLSRPANERRSAFHASTLLELSHAAAPCSAPHTTRPWLRIPERAPPSSACRDPEPLARFSDLCSRATWSPRPNDPAAAWHPGEVPAPQVGKATAARQRPPPASQEATARCRERTAAPHESKCRSRRAGALGRFVLRALERLLGETLAPASPARAFPTQDRSAWASAHPRHRRS